MWVIKFEVIPRGKNEGKNEVLVEDILGVKLR